MVVSRAFNLARRLRRALRAAPTPPPAGPDPVHFANVRVDEAKAGIVAGLIERAGGARDVKDFHGAALLYDAALAVQPDHFGLQVQAGHMHKEAGDLATAEARYLAAQALQPDDADLALQLGHFYKVAGRLERSEASYRRALALKPDYPDALHELSILKGRTAPPEPIHAAEDADLDRLVPELFPRREQDLRRTWVDAIHMRTLGARRERTRWGVMNTLRGIEAIRGFCISSEPIAEMAIAFNDRVLHRGPVDDLPLEGGREGQRKYVFNVWLDFSDFEPGAYQAEVRFADAGGAERVHREYVVVAEPLEEADFPDADALITLPDGHAGTLEEAINARPSVVRPAARNLLPPPKNVLVMRTDQLGDMVTSTPAVRRLRELLPDAKLVALVTAGNADFTRTLGVFDEVLVADFPDDRVERRRIMGPRAQAALRDRLAPYAFDICIDLAESAVSRPLMLLSGAKFLYGYYDREWPFLDGGFEGSSHDRKNYLETAPQSTKVRALIDRLGDTLQSRAEVIRRPELARDMLERYGIGPRERYAVFHTGARIVFSRWAHYPELAQMILDRTELKVVIITDQAGYRETLPPALASSDRFLLIDRLLPFDDFDALLSFCTVFVGNDTGPKHLASLRGAPVVSIHSSRINWGEWGQELTGSIISRKVPCAGCVIYHDEDECGKGFACITRITPEEVFAEVTRQIGAAAV